VLESVKHILDLHRLRKYCMDVIKNCIKITQSNG